jgi:thymidylate synthase
MSYFKISILPDKSSSPQEKGDFFEKIIGKVFEKQRYSVKERINFTGSEIDLILDHKDTKVSAYVECKAKERLESEEISKFVFNVTHRKKDFGFFIYTKDFQHQVGGIIDELINDPDKRYKNIQFWNADKIVELLVDKGDIKPFSLPLSKKRFS